MEDPQFDPNRRLCPDGACVGVIGTDETCTVCGRTAAAAAAGEDPPEEEAAAAAAGEDGGFDPTRRLCDDGSCVGLIGSDGTCNVCGRKAG
ncbi:MAG TPA: hypothetical protein VMT03_15625 [Polyangia bacterium]|nr:hypothetical protein [Polyangia bacterium]